MNDVLFYVFIAVAILFVIFCSVTRYYYYREFYRGFYEEKRNQKIKKREPRKKD